MPTIEQKLSDLGTYCDVLVDSAGFGVFGAAAATDRHEHLKLVDVNMRALTELANGEFVFRATLRVIVTTAHCWSCDPAPPQSPH